LQAYLPGWTTGFDAVVGRSSYSGVSIAATLAAQEPPPDVVVVELGTNDADPAAFLVNAQAILTSLRDVPLVIWQTAHRPASYTVDVNAAIAQATANFPNTVVADWDGFVPPEDLVSDGVHPQSIHEDDMARLLAPLLSAWDAVASKTLSTRCPH
jgi:lysophospholipase L1-like esterase